MNDIIMNAYNLLDRYDKNKIEFINFSIMVKHNKNLYNFKYTCKCVLVGGNHSLFLNLYFEYIDFLIIL